jgi:hypothetical protein
MFQAAAAAIKLLYRRKTRRHGICGGFVVRSTKG